MSSPRLRCRAFTLLEVLVATSIFVVVMTLSLGVFGRALEIWRRSSNDVQAFQSARLAYDIIGRNIEQATLNTYLDYLDSSDRFPSDPGYTSPPARYGRRSDLQYVSGLSGGGGLPGTPGTGTGAFFLVPYGFGGGSAPQPAAYPGLNELLNVCGFYVEFGDDSFRPAFVTSPARYRYRLKQLLAPTQRNEVFQASGEQKFTWFTNYVAADSYPVADNVIALIIIPIDPNEAIDFLTSDYAYDSRKKERDDPQPLTANQLPPTFRLTLVAIDEASALRMENGATEPAVIRSALTGKFKVVSDYDKDLADLEQALLQANIGYRTFSSTISIKESTWSKQ